MSTKKVLDTVADHLKSSDDPTNSLVAAKPNDHISKKVYMMPESYNALRRELEAHFPNLWTTVQGDMAFNAQRFIHKMDEALDLVTQFDSANVDGICKRYLDKLRSARGLSALHTSEEYHHNQAMEDQVKLARELHSEVAPWEKKRDIH